MNKLKIVLLTFVIVTMFTLLLSLLANLGEKTIHNLILFLILGGFVILITLILNCIAIHLLRFKNLITILALVLVLFLFGLSIEFFYVDSILTTNIIVFNLVLKKSFINP